MARTIPHRELRNNSAAVLREVQAGATFEITNHGQVVAVLIPPDNAGLPPLRSRPARVKGRFCELPRLRIEGTVREALDELRADR